MNSTQFMSPATRTLIACQDHLARISLEQELFLKGAAVDLAGRVVTVGAVLFLHAELVRHIGSLSVLMIRSVVLQPEPKQLEAKKVEFMTALTLFFAFMTVLFQKSIRVELPVPEAPTTPIGSVPEFSAPTPPPSVPTSPAARIPSPPLETAPLRSAPTPPPPVSTPAVARTPSPPLETAPLGSPLTPPSHVPASPAARTPSPELLGGVDWEQVGHTHAPAAAAAVEHPPSLWRPWSFLVRPAPAAAALPSVRIPSPENDEEMIKTELEVELAAARSSLAAQPSKTIKLTPPPSIYEEDPQWRFSCKTISSYQIGGAHFLSSYSHEQDRSQITSSFILTLGGDDYSGVREYEVFVALNIEAPRKSKAATYLRTRLVATLSDLLLKHNREGLSIKGIWNALNLVCPTLRTEYISIFSETDRLHDRAHFSLAMILEGAVWTLDLSEGGVLLINRTSKSESVEPLVVNNGSSTTPFFGALGSFIPRITTLPVRSSRHLVLASSALMNRLSGRGIGDAVCSTKEATPYALAKDLVHSAQIASDASHAVELSCLIIELPSKLLIIGSGGGSSVHTQSPSELSQGEIGSEPGLEYSDEEAAALLEATEALLTPEQFPAPPPRSPSPVRMAPQAPLAPIQERRPTSSLQKNVLPSPFSSDDEGDSPPIRSLADGPASRLAARLAQKSSDSDNSSYVSVEAEEEEPIQVPDVPLTRSPLPVNVPRPQDDVISLNSDEEA